MLVKFYINKLNNRLLINNHINNGYTEKKEFLVAESVAV